MFSFALTQPRTFWREQRVLRTEICIPCNAFRVILTKVSDVIAFNVDSSLSYSVVLFIVLWPTRQYCFVRYYRVYYNNITFTGHVEHLCFHTKCQLRFIIFQLSKAFIDHYRCVLIGKYRNVELASNSNKLFVSANKFNSPFFIVRHREPFKLAHSFPGSLEGKSLDCERSHNS